MIQTQKKILLIRFSSFGDVTQALSLPTRLAELSPPSGQGLEIHWLTREDLAPLIVGHPFVHKIWSLKKSSGFFGLLRLIGQLRKEGFSHIYDAHNNLRSHVVSLLLTPPIAVDRWFNPPIFLRKSQKRWKRFLLFRFHVNTYEMPFSGQRDLLEPLTHWGLQKTLPPAPQMFLNLEALAKAKTLLSDHQLSTFIALAPSAAYPLKRWPLAHFKKLIELHPESSFLCLGGKEDRFIQELVEMDPSRVFNLAGQLSLQESAAVISLSLGLVTNDTRLLHVGEQLGKKTIALMGPAPFGFPSRSSTKIMELNLSCKPCSKHGQGPCTNQKFQRCLVDITPDMISTEIRRWF